MEKRMDMEKKKNSAFVPRSGFGESKIGVFSNSRPSARFSFSFFSFLANPKAGLGLFILLLALFSIPAFADNPNDLTAHWGNGTAINNTVFYFSNTGPCRIGTDPNCQTDWTRLAMLAIAVCFFANVLIFVLGRTFHMQNLERLAKSEFYQVTASAIMIFSLTLLLTEGFQFIDQSGILPAGTTTICAGQPLSVGVAGPLQIIQCHLQEKITYVGTLFTQAQDVVDTWEPFSTTSIYWWGMPAFVADWMLPGPGAPYPGGLHQVVESGHYLANRMVPIAISLQAQFLLIGYIGLNMLPVFLPLGLILRIVPFLRGLGSLLVAIALGFYIIFPITYLLLDPNTVRPPPSDLLPNSPPPLQSPNQCYMTYSALVATATSPTLGLASGTASSSGTPAAGVDPSSIAQEVAELQVDAFYLPLCALAATLLFINTAAGLLGGDSGEIIHFVTKVI